MVEVRDEEGRKEGRKEGREEGRRHAARRDLFFTRPRVSLALLSLRKNGDYS